MQTVPYTDIQINEFGTCIYTDSMGGNREDNGYPNKSNYRVIKTGHSKFYYIHRLVARVFVENPAPRYFNVVHHIDHDRSNNHASNLEWTTHQMNNAQKVKMRLTKQTRTGYRVKFIFDHVVRNWMKIYKTKEEAYQAGIILKQQLINAKRAHIINCEKTGENINEQLCPTCGSYSNNTSV